MKYVTLLLQVLAAALLAILIPSFFLGFAIVVAMWPKFAAFSVLFVILAIIIVGALVPYFNFCWQVVRACIWNIPPKN